MNCSSQDSTKSWFITNKLIDKYMNILNINKFREMNTKWSKKALDEYSVEGRIYLEENNGQKAIPNTKMFREIDRAKIINKARAEKSNKLQQEKFEQEAKYKQLREGYDGREDLNNDINETDRLNLAKEINKELLQSSKGRSADRLQSIKTSQLEIEANKEFFSLRDSYQERTLSEAQKADQDEVFKVESNNSILSIVRQKLLDTNTLNGRLFNKLNTLDKIKCVITNKDLISVVGNNLYINPEKLNQHLEQTDGENYLDSLLSDTLTQAIENNYKQSYNNEAIWGIADSYQEFKDFKDKNKDLPLTELIGKFTKYKSEIDLGGQQNINLECL